MENSPLTLAYDYARAASAATQASDMDLAISQHTLAANEFSKAAKCTISVEAIRTLHLLEHHHQRLSQLIRPTSESSRSNSVDQETQKAVTKQSNTSTVVAGLRTKSDLATPLSPLRTPQALRQTQRPPPRDLSSSIASNLATARGIRANYTRQSLSLSTSKNQSSASLEALSRRDVRRSSVPTISEYPNPIYSTSTISSRKNEGNSENTALAHNLGGDEGFSRFYSTFENIVSKLTAPLAFAGLPLTIDESSFPAESSNLKLPGNRLSSKERASTDELDLTKYFSRTALRASTRDEYGVNDSFYVVPITGHTVSYAHILSFDQKEKRRMAVSRIPDNPDAITDLNDDEDFVDARETPIPLTTSIQRENSKELNSREKDNKIEELTMENASLKTAIDKLSRRLHTFEISAQYNSMALAESMRMMRDFSPARKEKDKETESEIYRDDKSLRHRVRELEENLRVRLRENDHLKKDNEKLMGIVTRYRERWEKLKEGAKSRREGKEGSTIET
ncbi:hypothetical protein EPUL_000928 [Erysiphe pulchra]|uniref:MIT domain-containing protein n=1 Tax=Erysiphe pulchra TaxID=225359 RepID=A0A2S4Q245_9PEZI|nr:hypothetical protein EPUL_000928 [Erysiphe pulchra]